MYKCKYFKLYELVPPEIYKGEDYLKHWFIFDDRCLRAIDIIREKFGKCVVNTWKGGGSHRYRGFRPFTCDIGAYYSQHKFGRAIDLVPLDEDVNTVRQYLIDTKGLDGLITGIELDVDWLHIDCRNYNGLYLFRP
ncbi:hypothetical protein [Thermoanaerobacter sp. A7A]|uniref:hypothetical protein n=1 Tax=Thermoanaerobacter sp. A7A TaxID=1350366 RepID=UPI00040566E8|nr:hypothetical protein [Thermoanaerobacter sp. A7A]